MPCSAVRRAAIVRCRRRRARAEMDDALAAAAAVSVWSPPCGDIGDVGDRRGERLQQFQRARHPRRRPAGAGTGRSAHTSASCRRNAGRRRSRTAAAARARCTSAICAVAVPSGVAGKRAIEVALVDRRGARAGGSAAGKFADVRKINRPRTSLASSARSSVRVGDLALVLVAVIAGHQQHARTRAVADAGDRDRDPAIGRTVHRMRQAQEADLLAVAVEVDFAR